MYFNFLFFSCMFWLFYFRMSAFMINQIHVHTYRVLVPPHVSLQYICVFSLSINVLSKWEVWLETSWRLEEQCGQKVSKGCSCGCHESVAELTLICGFKRSVSGSELVCQTTHRTRLYVMCPLSTFIHPCTSWGSDSCLTHGWKHARVCFSAESFFFFFLFNPLSESRYEPTS